MYKYVVTWFIIKTSFGLCPHMPQYDAFGRDTAGYKATDLIRNCWSTDTTTKTKEFTKRVDAAAFIKKGQDQIAKENAAKNPEYVPYDYDYGRLSEFKLDSIKIK